MKYIDEDFLLVSGLHHLLLRKRVTYIRIIKIGASISRGRNLSVAVTGLVSGLLILTTKSSRNI